MNIALSAFQAYKQQDNDTHANKLKMIVLHVKECVDILNEDRSTHPARSMDALERVDTVFNKIVAPYLRKLRIEQELQDQELSRQRLQAEALKRQKTKEYWMQVRLLPSMMMCKYYNCLYISIKH